MTWSFDTLITMMAWVGGGPAIVAVVVFGLLVRAVTKPIKDQTRRRQLDRESPRRTALREVLTEMPIKDGNGAAGARRIVIDLLDDGATVSELVEVCERGTQLSPDDRARADEFHTIAYALANNA